MAEPRGPVDEQQSLNERSLIERECKELEEELQELQSKLRINAEEGSKLKEQSRLVEHKLHHKRRELQKSVPPKERTRSAEVSDISLG